MTIKNLQEIIKSAAERYGLEYEEDSEHVKVKRDDGTIRIITEDDISGVFQATVKPVRAHKLNDGDVITVKELTMQFENKLLYEVKFCGYDEYMQSIWNKTGKSFTAEELNEYCK